MIFSKQYDVLSQSAVREMVVAVCFKCVYMYAGLKHHLEVCKHQVFLQKYAVKCMALYADDMLLYKHLQDYQMLQDDKARLHRRRGIYRETTSASNM